MTEKELKPVEVSWVDAQSSMDIMLLKDVKDYQNIVTKSCGYLAYQDKEKVVLAFMLFGKDEEDRTLLKHYQIIPKGMIKNIKHLK